MCLVVVTVVVGVVIAGLVVGIVVVGLVSTSPSSTIISTNPLSYLSPPHYSAILFVFLVVKLVQTRKGPTRQPTLPSHSTHFVAMGPSVYNPQRGKKCGREMDPTRRKERYRETYVSCCLDCRREGTSVRNGTVAGIVIIPNKTNRL